MRNPRKKALLSSTKTRNKVLWTSVLVIVIAIGFTLAPPILDAFGKDQVQQTVGETQFDRNVDRYPEVATASEDKLDYQESARELEVQKAKQEAEAARIKAAEEKAALVRSQERKRVVAKSSTNSGKARNGVTATRKYKSGVEQWRSTIVKDLKMWGCYSKSNEALAMRIINGESRGNPYAHRAGSQYYGLCQFGSGWVKGMSPSKYGTDADWRMNPYTSIRKMTKCIRDGSVYSQFSTAR